MISWLLLGDKMIGLEGISQRLGYIAESGTTQAAFIVRFLIVGLLTSCISALGDRPKVKFEKMIDGYAGFLCLDKKGEPLVAMHWEGRFSHMVGRYNSIFKVQMPKITPHVCRHTYCSIQAKSGMNPKTLQYLLGHSEIGVTLNTYTHLGLEDAAEELKRMEDLEKARKEIYGEEIEKTIKQNMFRVV